MVASSIPCKLSLSADRAQARAGGWIASSDIDVADTFTSTHCTIASPQELHGYSWPSYSTGTRSFCCNHQYSVTAITTSTGAIAERYAYTAYGQPTILNASGTVISATTLSNRYTYTGREWDATLGLHHFRARWMSPSAGRFLGRDPIPNEMNQHYVFIGAISNLDPSGMIEVSTKKVLEAGCGGQSSANWDFLLDNGHPCGYSANDPYVLAGEPVGWIVQKVSVSCWIRKGCVESWPSPCGGIIIFIPNAEVQEESYSYYEAWPVAYRDRRTKLKINAHTDEAKFTAIDKTQGGYLQKGEVKFFCNSAIGSDLRTNPKWHNPSRSGVKFHGNLCRTTSYLLLSWSENENGAPPPFWENGDTDGEKSGTRSFDLSWSCCSNKSVKLDITPPK